MAGNLEAHAAQYDRKAPTSSKDLKPMLLVVIFLACFLLSLLLFKLPLGAGFAVGLCATLVVGAGFLVQGRLARRRVLKQRDQQVQDHRRTKDASVDEKSVG